MSLLLYLKKSKNKGQSKSKGELNKILNKKNFYLVDMRNLPKNECTKAI
jgi:hypothetical protein